MVAVAGLEQRRREFVERRLKAIQATIARNGAAFLVESVGIGIDGMRDEPKVTGGLGFDTIRQLGYVGWEVSSVVPSRSGNVVSFHFLVRYVVTAANLDASRELVEKHFTVEATRLVK